MGVEKKGEVFMCMYTPRFGYICIKNGNVS